MGVLINLSILFSSMLCLVFGISLDNVNLYFLSILMIFLCSVIYCITNIREKIVYFLFLVTFFVFLLGSYFIQFLGGGEWWVSFYDGVLEAKFEVGNLEITMIALYLALFGLLIGNWFNSKINYKIKIRKRDTVRNYNTIDNGIKRVSTILYCITYIGAFINTIYKIVFISNASYLSYYREYVGIPIFEQMASANDIVFYIYLATMPNKRKSIPYIGTYLLMKILSLLTGARSNAIVAILIILFYCYFRQANSKKIGVIEIWITKRMIGLGVIILPILVVLLKLISIIRAGQSFNDMSFWELFVEFFQTQGGSVHLISYAELYKEQLPSTNLSYVFGPIINLLKSNSIIQMFSDFSVYKSNTLEAAMYGNSLSNTISYLVMPYNFYHGMGMGSCYIAELMVDFGYIGVFIFNVTLGNILNMYSKIRTGSILKTTILLLMLEGIFIICRASALQWAVIIFKDSTILVILTVYVTAYILSKIPSNGRRRNEIKSYSINKFT